MTECKRCRSLVPEYANFCGHCGQAIDDLVHLLALDEQTPDEDVLDDTPTEPLRRVVPDANVAALPSLNGVSAYQTKAEKHKKRELQTGRHTVKRVLQAFEPYKFQVILILVAILTTTGLNLVSPLLLPSVFDSALANRNVPLLLVYAGIMVIATLLSGMIGVAQTYLSNRVGQQVMRDLRDKLYDRLQDMSLQFFTSMRTGEIQSRLSNDVSGAQTAVTDTFINAVSSIITTLGTIVAMLYLSPLLTLVSFVFLPVFLYFTLRVGNVRRRSTSATQKSLASLNALMQETLSISGVLLIKMFGRKALARQLFRVENQKLTDLSIRQQMVGRWLFMFMNTFSVLMPVATYITAGLLIAYAPDRAHITMGKLVSFIMLQGRFFGPFSQLLALQVNLQGSLALFDRIFEYLDLPVEIQDIPNAVQLTPAEVYGEVAFHNVSFTYKRNQYAVLSDVKAEGSADARKRQKIQKQNVVSRPLEYSLTQESQPRMTLHNVSFAIKPGQLAALVGPSGAGKTTMTYLIPRLYDVDCGSVTIDGRDVREISLASLGTLIGVVTQETYLFHTSIRQNLLYVRPDATDEEMVAAAKAAAIHDRIMELDNGYETIVGERGYRLSGGEKQRIAIARVLLKDPRILILDEATSSLDTQSERLIQTALRPLMKGRTTIAIAHRLSTVLSADLILVVDKGEIVEQGTHQNLLDRNGLYAKLYHQQFAQQLQEEPSIS